jgi:hypothetical protein
LASIALLYAAWNWSRPRRYTSRCDVSTTSRGRPARYGVGVEIHVIVALGRDGDAEVP